MLFSCRTYAGASGYGISLNQFEAIRLYYDGISLNQFEAIRSLLYMEIIGNYR